MESFMESFSDLQGGFLYPSLHSLLRFLVGRWSISISTRSLYFLVGRNQMQ